MKITKQSLLYCLPLIVLTLILLTRWQTSQSQSISLSSNHLNLPSLFQPANRFTAQMFQGKVVLLNVWSSGCSACRQEHSTLLTIKNSVPIYGIIFNDDEENAKAWLRDHGNPYTAIGVDSESTLATTLNIDAIPDTFLIDKHGIIRYNFIGSLTINTWNNTLQPLVKQLNSEL